MKNIQDKAQEFLTDYIEKASIVAPADVSTYDIPMLWLAVISASPQDRVKELIKIWRSGLDQELSLSIVALSNQIKEVFVINKQDTYSLLYAIEAEGEIYFYEGLNPDTFATNDEDINRLIKSDEKLNWFYTRLHNGWYFLPAQTLGLLPAQELFSLDTKEWSLLEGIEVDLNLSKTIAFFHNGAGGYLCLNFEDEQPKGVLWWNDEEPTIGINFWDYLDEWIKIGLEN